MSRGTLVQGDTCAGVTLVPPPNGVPHSGANDVLSVPKPGYYTLQNKIFQLHTILFFDNLTKQSRAELCQAQLS